MLLVSLAVDAEAMWVVPDPAGRETSLPRMSGMMQNLHLWSQPSEILR